MPQGLPTEAPRQQLSDPTMQLPPNTMMVPMQYFTIALWFSIYVGETDNIFCELSVVSSFDTPRIFSTVEGLK